MESKIIIMLTNNDKTVTNALEVFEDCKHLPIDFWGFKNVGIPTDEMRELHATMKDAGKKTFLEVVTYTEESCMAGAKLAVDFGFDYLMGTILFPSVWEYLKDQPISYYPFVGGVSGSPSILEGSTQSMLAETEKFKKMGIPGVDILAYRFVDGDPEVLAKDFVAGTDMNVVVAGSISSPERIAIVNGINPWAFTMGTALFGKKFVADGSFLENVEKVLEVMDAL